LQIESAFRYASERLEHPDLASMRQAVDMVLAVDRHWTLVAANKAVAPLRQQAEHGADPVLKDLLNELRAYPMPIGVAGEIAPRMIVPFKLKAADGVLSFISTTMVFGTSLDVTSAKLAIESFSRPTNSRLGRWRARRRRARRRKSIIGHFHKRGWPRCPCARPEAASGSGRGAPVNGNAHLTNRIRDRHPQLHLLQYRDNLFDRKSLPFHDKLPALRGPSLPKN
jgi:hypothetical protein